MKLIALIKRRFVQHTTWVLNHFNLCIVSAAAFLLLWIVLLMASFLFGYWCNGLFGTKFEISACITGVGALATGVGTLWVTARGVMDKYRIDSELNSKQGEMPNEVKK